MWVLESLILAQFEILNTHLVHCKIYGPFTTDFIHIQYLFLMTPGPRLMRVTQHSTPRNQTPHSPIKCMWLSTECLE